MSQQSQLAVVLAVADAMTGLAYWITAYLASRGTLKVNGWSGIRTATTMSSETAWEAAHRAALPWATGAVVLGLAAALGSVALLFASDNSRLALIVAAVGIAVLTILAVPMFIAATNGARGQV